MKKNKNISSGETGEVFETQHVKVEKDGECHYSVGIAIDGLTPEEDGSFFAIFSAEEARKLGFILINTAVLQSLKNDLQRAFIKDKALTVEQYFEEISKQED